MGVSALCPLPFKNKNYKKIIKNTHIKGVFFNAKNSHKKNNNDIQ